METRLIMGYSVSDVYSGIVICNSRQKGRSEEVDESDCSLANLGLLAYLGHSLAKDKHLMSDLFAARFTLFTLILTILTIED